VGAALGIEQISLKFANRQAVLAGRSFFEKIAIPLRPMALQKNRFYPPAGSGD
jgi:hypothetical protein